ncbi:hypothetical protein ABTL60_19915, partial [Acinetobacter baumannii]
WLKDAPRGPANGTLRAAVDDSDTVLVLAEDGGTWRWKVNASATEAGQGVKPGTTTRRTGPYDPAWFDAAAVKPDLDLE